MSQPLRMPPPVCSLAVGIRATFSLISLLLCSIVAFAQEGAKSLAATALFPASDNKEICPDTPLKITFAAPPSLGTGKIQVCDAADDSVVETIDVAAQTRTMPIGGLANYKYYPVMIRDNQVALYLPNHALKYGKTYYVKVDDGAIKGKNGEVHIDLNPTGQWRFTTKAAPPAAGSKKLTVAADGRGDFCTIQAALDFIPNGNTTPTTIFIRKGLYTEMNYVSMKHAITLLGEDRKETVLEYATNDRFNSSATGGGYRRGVFRANRCNDLVLANFTIRNTTPQGGSQAETIIFNGTTSAHAIVTHVDLYSFQDTLQINGQAYVSHSYIEGDVDFMWGTGPCFFEDCEAKTVRNNAYYTQIRNPASNHGYIYKNCTFSGAPNITGNILSRIALATYPASEVVLINCVLTSAVSPAAWRLDGGGTNAPNLHFWEYNSHDPDGNPVDVSRRFALSKQLKLPDDKETIANYSDPKFVLGGQWTPSLAPIITKQPASLGGIWIGQKAEFVVEAVAVPDATYQWRKGGVDLSGEKNSKLLLESAPLGSSGDYAVVVSNSAGTVTSEPAHLQVVTGSRGP